MRYPSMDVIVLRLFKEFTRWALAMNHPPSHRNGCCEYMVEKILLIGMSHGIDTPFGKS